MKKEELQKKVGELESQKQRLENNDQFIRQEFASAFSWYKSGTPYYRERELLVPTWEQIFVEIGKLKAIEDFRNLEGKIDDIRYRIEQLENVNTETNPHP